MKLIELNSRHSRRTHGSVVLVLLVFLTLMLMLCAATSHALHLTQQEVALIEKHQTERLSAMTNVPPLSTNSLHAP